MKKIYLFMTMIFTWTAGATLLAQTVRLTNINSEEGDSYLSMAYDNQGRLTQIESEWGGERFDISYDPIVIQEYELRDDIWQHIYTHAVTIDDQGRICEVKATGIPYTSPYDGDGVSTGFVDIYTYNHDGYLTQFDRTWEGGDTDVIRYTWVDGNLVNLSWTQTYRTNWYEGGILHEGYATDYGQAVTTYGDKLSPNGSVTLGLWYAYAGMSLECFSGLFGKTCRNLPTQVVLSSHTDYPEEYPKEYSDEEESKEVLTFNYVLNADGYVASENYQDEYDGEVEETALIYNYTGMGNGLSKLHKGNNLQLHQRGSTIYIMLDNEYDELQILNAAGQTVKRIPVGEGQRQVTFSARGLGSGVNVVRATGRNAEASRKFIVK